MQLIVKNTSNTLERYSELKRKYRLEDKLVIGHVGRFAPEKNHKFIVDVFDEIYETRAGGVISSHCGPGTLGVLFIAGE